MGSGAPVAPPNFFQAFVSPVSALTPGCGQHSPHEAGSRPIMWAAAEDSALQALT